MRFCARRISTLLETAMESSACWRQLLDAVVRVNMKAAGGLKRFLEHLQRAQEVNPDLEHELDAARKAIKDRVNSAGPAKHILSQLLTKTFAEAGERS
jgi:hypothetical protein